MGFYDDKREVIFDDNVTFVNVAGFGVDNDVGNADIQHNGTGLQVEVYENEILWLPKQENNIGQNYTKNRLPNGINSAMVLLTPSWEWGCQGRKKSHTKDGIEPSVSVIHTTHF